MYFNKILWLDTETTSLDPKVANIREMAYVKEVEGKQVGELKSFQVQPILHLEDKLYGHRDIREFCAEYNRQVGHPADPDCLTTFQFADGEPLFFHSKAALTFNLTPPDIVNPVTWLIGKEIISASKMLSILLEDLDQHSDVQGRWILAGHNVRFDFEVMVWWIRRLLGDDEAKNVMNYFNRYVFLDTLALTRWFQYSGLLKTQKANLGAVAAELGIDVAEMHTAFADVFASRSIARFLLRKTNDDKDSDG